jgi:hypothetical protein
MGRVGGSYDRAAGGCLDRWLGKFCRAVALWSAHGTSGCAAWRHSLGFPRVSGFSVSEAEREQKQSAAFRLLPRT